MVVIFLLTITILTACSMPTYGPSQPSNQTSVKPAPSKSLIQLNNKAGLGDYLVGVNIMALYYRTSDSDGQSNCYGSCASAWPPFLAEVVPMVSPNITGTVGLITRTDGTKQVTYNGWPLYYYSGDVNSGDTNGQGINSIWYVVPQDLVPSTLVTPAPLVSPIPN